MKNENFQTINKKYKFKIKKGIPNFKYQVNKVGLSQLISLFFKLQAVVYFSMGLHTVTRIMHLLDCIYRWK